MNKTLRTGSLAAVILILVGVLAWFFAAKHRGRSTEAAQVRVVSPRVGSIEDTISASGVVLPKNRLEIKPPVNGRIESILVNEGGTVESGQVIGWMSSTERAAILDAARGESAEAFAHWQQAYKSIPLIAPIDGIVIVAKIQPGQSVTAQDAVIVLSDRTIVRANVDETDIAQVRTGMHAHVTLDAYPDTRIDARVDHIYYESQTINNVTVYEVDVIPARIPSFFRSGMNATVEFVVAEKNDALLIPAEAVQRRKGRTVVTVRVGQQEEERDITLGISADTDVEVTSGLTTADQVLIKSAKLTLKQNSGKNPFMPSRPRR